MLKGLVSNDGKKRATLTIQVRISKDCVYRALMSKASLEGALPSKKSEAVEAIKNAFLFYGANCQSISFESGENEWDPFYNKWEYKYFSYNCKTLTDKFFPDLDWCNEPAVEKPVAPYCPTCGKLMSLDVYHCDLLCDHGEKNGQFDHFSPEDSTVVWRLMVKNPRGK